jgi:plasmid stabilization system protein ParE
MTGDLVERFESIRGVNYVPSNAVNATQMWQEFDAGTIDRELGFAQELGLNGLRVFIQYLAFEDDAAGLIDRLDAFLELASGHGLSVMPVLFDDCWLPEPFLGDQTPEARPGRHNPYWQRSPGKRRTGLSFRPSLRRYVEDLLTTFGRDRRIIAWDLYNEPQNSDPSVALVRDVFDWARRIAPSQPLTACWYGALLSDITSIHFYVSPARNPDEARRLIESAKSFARPVVVTEALGRPNHGELDEILPLFNQNGIGWYLWELMIGADQTRYQWPDSAQAADEIVFQGLLHPDGTPYRRHEVDLLRAHAETPSGQGSHRALPGDQAES